MTRIAVVGAGGAVGRTMLDLLARQPLSDEPPICYGSRRSAGQRLPFGSETVTVRLLEEDALESCDVALFSAGSGVSRRWATRFLEHGAAVIDNSSAFRMDEGVPLVVPEINGGEIPDAPGIIANPNCSTIILLMAIHALRALGRFRVVVSTYQAVSGAGQGGIVALEREQAGGAFESDNPFPFPIAGNLFALIGEPEPVADDGLGGATTEESKMIHESRKILDIPELEVYTWCVRVPVRRCHSEAVTLFFDAPVSRTDAERLIAGSPGVILERDPKKPPTPADIAGHDDVWVGRLRRPAPDVLQLWAVGDQLLKGAALNAVQIAQAYLDKKRA